VSKSPNRVLVIVIGLIVVAVAIVTVLSSTKSAVVLDRATPAGSVQAYLKAILVGKNAEAAKLLSPDSVCTVTDIDRAYVVDTARVVLVDSTVKGATAEVRVRVEIPSGSPLGDVMTKDHTFRLVNSEGAWLVTGIPWPLFDCGVSAK
jgi:sugar lactone lactonase YvrE